ncbi:tRNA pseudouridine synthase A [Insulibacter thermoxylanivorax]|uniref:tRNA pseudouridine synthase A n=2 Tax=Insulibacter thermoxylanivorax TaxID=2749268 RepID=A0A916QDN9_9BACL|nr:tRNA pseudouridine synthase A [Insulibacter thermoxylanivorax]
MGKVIGMRRNIRLTVSYDGTDYQGFQAQSHTDQTIQTQLEHAIYRLTGTKTSVIGSGRTDAGVHARGQVVNFYTDSSIPIERWALALNSLLPKDIVVTEAKAVSEDFHARKSARKKTYRYTINNRRFPDVLMRRYQYHVPVPLRLEPMEQALQLLVGEHDFTSFCSAKSTQASHVRTIYEARLAAEEDGVLHIYVTGNGFLYNMVRIIAGTIIEVGLGKRTVEDIRRLLELQDRTKSGITAPPHGLVLWEVFYDEE